MDPRRQVSTKGSLLVLLLTPYILSTRESSEQTPTSIYSIQCEQGAPKKLKQSKIRWLREEEAM